MSIFYHLKTAFAVAALILALFNIAADIWRKDWKCVLWDICVYFAFYPLWITAGFTLLAACSEMVYSLFPGIWIYSGFLLWCVPHSLMVIRAVRKNDRYGVVSSAAGVGAVCSAVIFIHLLDLTG